MPDAAVYGPPSLDKALGSLPVVASFLEDLNVAGTIDELCPVRDVALATHGQQQRLLDLLEVDPLKPP